MDLLSQFTNANNKDGRGKELAKALLAAFSGSFISDDEAELLIHSYLEHDGASLDRYTHHAGTGSEEFRKLAEQVKSEKILVLGPAGSIEHTAKKLQKEKERMAVPHPAAAIGGRWEFYTTQAIHARRVPHTEKHDGIAHWVRVTLPEHDAPLLHPHAHDIETPIGWVKANDHMAFSNDALRKYKFHHHYPNGINGGHETPVLPAFERMELITPARYDGFRFAPVALFVAYLKKDDTLPYFYIMESGNGLGFPKVMYPSGTDLDIPRLMKSNYKGTPFTSADNFYQLKTTFKGNHPDQISIKVFTKEQLEKDPANFHLSISLQFEASTLDDVASIDNFIPPSSQVLMAFLRIEQLRHHGIPTTPVVDIHHIADAIKEKLGK